jgi:probable F420-dependent oxidoreductase
MAHATRLGVTLPVPPDAAATLRMAEWAEGEGFDGLWFADTGEIDALTLAAAVTQRVRRARIGIAVVPVYTRTPVVLASSAATLAHLAPGRIVIGLGASSHAMIEGWHGLKLEKPLTRVKETALALRQALSGQATQFQGETLRSAGFKLANPPVPPVPIMLAALRGKMLEMAAAVGDGVIVNLFPAPALPRIMQHIRAGAAQAGKDAAALEIVCRHQICVTDDPARARDTFRKRFGPYFATPVYNRFLAWCGHEDAAREIEAGFKAKDRARTGAAFSDALIDQIAVIGTAEQCRERIRALVQGGITTPVVSCFSPDPKEFLATHEAFTPARFGE